VTVFIETVGTAILPQFVQNTHLDVSSFQSSFVLLNTGHRSFHQPLLRDNHHWDRSGVWLLHLDPDCQQGRKKTSSFHFFGDVLPQHGSIGNNHLLHKFSKPKSDHRIFPKFFPEFFPRK
jgi:hypothetical protein